MRALLVGIVRWFALAGLIMHGGLLAAQMVQYGFVVEMNSGGKPLPNVAISIPMAHDCQPTVSDAFGLFRLNFGEHKVGDVVMGLNARKYGYELVNKHIVEGYTLTDRDTLRIVMAPAEKLKEARERYYALLEAASIKRYDSTMTFLRDQYVQQIITKPELDYWQSLAEAELKVAYQNLDDYSDCLARINEDDLNVTEMLVFKQFVDGDAEAGLALIGDLPESSVYNDYLVFLGIYPMTNPEVRVDSGKYDLLNIPDSLYSDVIAFSGYNDRYESGFMANGLHYAQSCQHLGMIFLNLSDPVLAAECFRKALKMYELLNEMDGDSYLEQIKELQRQIKSLE